MVTEEILLEHWRKLKPEKPQILGWVEQLKYDSEITSLESDLVPQTQAPKSYGQFDNGRSQTSISASL